MEKHPIHIKQPELQKSPEVQRAVARKEQEHGKKLPNDPSVRIEAYMDRIENIFLNPDEHTRKRNIELFRDKIHDALLIKRENFPESYFELQKRIARNRGQGNIDIPPEMREQMIDAAIEDQRHSLDRWIDYLSSEDALYPTWFKYYAWTQVIKLSQFDKERGEFKKRTDNTAAPFPDIYRAALAHIADLYERVKDDNKDSEARSEFDKRFPSLYAEYIQESLAGSIENREAIEGAWVKFAQGDDEAAAILWQSLEGRGTGWCTEGRTTAETQIASGDFYVYYTNDHNSNPTQPRLAIRMNGTNAIGEVRGILPHQNVEPQFQEVLDEKLTEFGVEAERFRKKSEDMRRLTLLEHNQEPFTKDDLTFLYEIKAPIEGFGYDKDPRIQELLEHRDVRTDLSMIFDCTPEMISLTREEALRGGIRFHYGDLNLRNLATAEGLTLPETVGGSLYLGSLATAEGLTLPQTVGGYLHLNSLTTAEGLTLPQTVGGDLHLANLRTAEGLTLPETVGGSLYLGSLATAEGLTLPKTIGGDLNLANLRTAEGLTLPKTIGGDLNLANLRTAEKNQLRTKAPHLRIM